MKAKSKKRKGKSKEEDKIDPYNQKLGASLMAFRKSRKLTQAQIAEVIGVTHQQYQRYEVGYSSITCKYIAIIADYFNANIIEFLGAMVEKTAGNIVIKEGNKSIDEKGNVTQNIKIEVNNTIIQKETIATKMMRMIGNMENLIKNKIVMPTLTIGFLIIYGIQIIKLTPAYNIEYGVLLLSSQYVVMSIVIAVVVSFTLPLSLLTYAVSFFAIGSTVSLLNIFVSVPFFLSGNPNGKKAIIYGISLILTVMYIKWLKSWKLKHDKEETRVLTQPVEETMEASK